MSPSPSQDFRVNPRLAVACKGSANSGKRVYSRISVIETSRGMEVADAARFGEEARKNRVRFSELSGTIEFPSAKQSRLLVAIE